MLALNRLNPKQVRSLPSGWHSDGNNLYLRVVGQSRSWVYRAMVCGRRYTKIIGYVPQTTLRDARIEAVRLKYLEKPAVLDKEVLFKDYYSKAVDHFVMLKKWKHPERARRLLISRLENYAVPLLGKRPISAITKEDVIKVLKQVWTDKPSVGVALQGDLARILELATQQGFRSGDNPAEWKNNLEFALPARSKVAPIVHNARVSIEGLPEFVAKVLASNSVFAKSAIFGILTATRKREFCDATWSEIDMENKVWSIAASRRKDSSTEPFRVPLSDQAVALLSSIPRSSDRIFGKSCYSYMGRFYKKNGADFTPHGMRSTFRDWGQENGKDFTLMEKSLCHAVGNAVTKAYQRSDCLEQRRPIMQEWADYCYSAIKG